MIRVLKEKMETAAISMKVEGAKPINESDMAIAINPMVIGIRLSYFETSHPESGRPAIELIGINSRIVPSSASL